MQFEDLGSQNGTKLFGDAGWRTTEEGTVSSVGLALPDPDSPTTSTATARPGPAATATTETRRRRGEPSAAGTKRGRPSKTAPPLGPAQGRASLRGER